MCVSIWCVCSPLSGRDYSLADPVSGGVYHFTVCGTLQSVSECAGLSACVVNGTGEYNWGDRVARGLDWYASDNDKTKGVQYFLSGETAPTRGSYMSSIAMRCAEEQGEWRGMDASVMRRPDT